MSLGWNASRRAFVALAALASVGVTPRATAQFGGGRSRERGGSPSSRGSHNEDATPRRASPPSIDPAEAIERELPSLRIDLKLTPEQASYFDSYERQVRLAASAGRIRARHVDAYRNDDGSSVKATALLRTIADDDADRADADRVAIERLDALYAVLTPDQQKQFDARTIQALHEPLGNT
jgi:hypothetical protein